MHWRGRHWQRNSGPEDLVYLVGAGRQIAFRPRHCRKKLAVVITHAGDYVGKSRCPRVSRGYSDKSLLKMIESFLAFRMLSEEFKGCSSRGRRIESQAALKL